MNNNTEIKICICKQCGKEFECTHRRKYCTTGCSDEVRRIKKRNRWRENNNYKEPEPRTCEACGKWFKPKPNARTAKCCSKQCGNTLYKRNKEGRLSQSEWEEIRNKQTLINQLKNVLNKHIKIVERTEEKVCVECGNHFITDIVSKKYCSKKCSNRHSHRNRDKRINESNLVDKDITLRKLYKRDNGICYICNEPCDPNNIKTNPDGYKYSGPTYPSIDHLIPLARHGKHAWDNIRLAHLKCNVLKSDELVEGIVDYIPDNAYQYKRELRSVGRKVVYQYDKQGNLINTFKSTAEASRKLNIKAKQIQNCARGECKTYQGFIWKYVQ